MMTPREMRRLLAVAGLIVLGVALIFNFLPTHTATVQAATEPSTSELLACGNGVFTTVNPMTVQAFGKELALFKATHPKLHVVQFGANAAIYGGSGSYWIINCDSVGGQ